MGYSGYPCNHTIEREKKSILAYFICINVFFRRRNPLVTKNAYTKRIQFFSPYLYLLSSLSGSLSVFIGVLCLLARLILHTLQCCPKIACIDVLSRSSFVSLKTIVDDDDGGGGGGINAHIGKREWLLHIKRSHK